MINSKNRFDFEISNNDDQVLGSFAHTKLKFSKDESGSDIYQGVDMKSSLITLDLGDFRDWSRLNKLVINPTPDIYMGIGFGIIHEYFHLKGVGLDNKTTRDNISGYDQESPVIEIVNKFQVEANCGRRMSHQTYRFKNGTAYIPFDDGKFYIIE